MDRVLRMKRHFAAAGRTRLRGEWRRDNAEKACPGQAGGSERGRMRGQENGGVGIARRA